MTSKYDRLTDHLATFDAPTVTLTFTDIEAVVGPLPVSARRRPAWWGATTGGTYRQPHVFHWRRAGWAADRPDFAHGRVRFRRVGSPETP